MVYAIDRGPSIQVLTQHMNWGDPRLIGEAVDVNRHWGINIHGRQNALKPLHNSLLLAAS
jgi:hypothetical protein